MSVDDDWLFPPAPVVGPPAPAPDPTATTWRLAGTGPYRGRTVRPRSYPGTGRVVLSVLDAAVPERRPGMAAGELPTIHAPLDGLSPEERAICRAVLGPPQGET